MGQVHHIAGPGDEASWGAVVSTRDPRYDDSYDQLIDSIAVDEAALASENTAHVLGWLCDQTYMAEEEQVSLGAFVTGARDLSEASVAELVVLLFSAPDDVALRAAHAMRERFTEAREAIAREGLERDRDVTIAVGDDE